jgi:hypothetical protein
MKDRLRARLEQLKTELSTGETMLADLDARRASLRDSLLRISGAIRVLEEELAAAEDLPGPAPNGRNAAVADAS